MTVQVCPTAEKDSMKIESFLFAHGGRLPLKGRNDKRWQKCGDADVSCSKIAPKNNLEKNQIFLQQEFPKSKNYTIFVSFR